ncbi:MAG: hypothetical protein JWR90_2214 [Marmoricola sp.]|jgi:hypothetical protein|nr:hypothetical protein [Marmoricola sp.]
MSNANQYVPRGTCGERRSVRAPGNQVDGFNEMYAVMTFRQL